ncbi:hypothetical protein [Streptomyces sp. CAU 1734]|uniref:hypothetical protein n=1 Tax=Streptomyces sp. CAU 1734 TaxID=3140360 RepID=UPI003260A3AF
MTGTDPHHAIGRLHFARGPGELRIWSAAQPPWSALHDCPVEVNILLEGTDDIGPADPALIGEILGRLDHYIGTALRFVRGALAADPAFFGLTPAESEPFRDLPVSEFPLDTPQLNFYAGEWHLRFAGGRLPVCDPYGLAVVFIGQRPLRVEDLSDATEEPERRHP